MLGTTERPVEKSLTLPQPILWVNSHARDIATAAFEYRFNYQLPMRDRPELSPNQREISEMPLCMSLGTIASRFGLPTGFEVVLGSVTVYDRKSGRELQGIGQHMYLERATENGSREALCLFPGQYILSVDHTQPEKGQRIRQLRSVAAQSGAAELVQSFPDVGVAALYGDTEKIREVFGFNYGNQPLQRFF